jgi:hypothetical protein
MSIPAHLLSRKARDEHVAQSIQVLTRHVMQQAQRRISSKVFPFLLFPFPLIYIINLCLFSFFLFPPFFSLQMQCGLC